MNTTEVAQTGKPAPKLWISGLLGGALALIGSLVLFGIARLLGIPLLVAGGPPGQSLPAPLTALQIIVAVLVPALAATGMYALLRRVYKQRASRIFQVVALIVLLLSFGAPLSQDVSTDNKIILALMHLVTAAAIVWALTLRK
jgi:hypothetical protein